MKTLKGRLSITNPSLSSGKEFIKIRLEDENSGIRVLEIRISHEEFSKGLMKVACRPVEFNIRDRFKDLGLVMEKKPFSVNLGLNKNIPYKNRQDLAKSKAQEECPEGWEPSLYFGAQNSFTYDNSGEEQCLIAHTYIYRYV